jgi:hypothetical protein
MWDIIAPTLEKRMRGKRMTSAWLAGAFLCLASATIAEVIYLNNGDVLHGTVIGASERAITLQTPFGNLVIPKIEIRRIDYEGAEPPSSPEAPQPSPDDAPSGTPVTRDRPAVGQATVTLDVRGDSFWYAFAGTVDKPADARIRLRLSIDGEEATLLLDAKHDTEDGTTLYNSFTFAPEDTQVISTSQGYSCRLEKIVNEEGREGVLLLLGVPQASGDEPVLLRMVYQVNEGSLEFPRWTNALSRSFPVPLEAGKETLLVLQQDASGLQFTGFFRKTMKNLESFQIRVLSSEVRNPL